MDREETLGRLADEAMEVVTELVLALQRIRMLDGYVGEHEDAAARLAWVQKVADDALAMVFATKAKGDTQGRLDRV